MRVNLIGTGRVGQSLLHLLKAQPGYQIGAVNSRRLAQAERLVSELGLDLAPGHDASPVPSQNRTLSQSRGHGLVRALDQMPQADLWLIAVPDDQIAGLAAALASARPLDADDAGSIAVHFSGATSSSALQPLRQRGWHLASCHPVRSFADPAQAAAQFGGTLCGIEGDAAALPAVNALVDQLGGVAFQLRADAKLLYHAAAVFSNNFATVLQAMAQELWQAAGVTEEVAGALQQGLMQSTLDNIRQLGPQAALTGPAARGDQAAIAAQAQALMAWRAEAGALYATLSEAAQRLKSSGQAFGN